MNIGALVSIASSIYAAMSASKPAEKTATADTATTPGTAMASPSTVVTLTSQDLPHEVANDVYASTVFGSARRPAAAMSAAASTATATPASRSSNDQVVIGPAQDGYRGIDPNEILLPNRENIAAMSEQVTARLGNALDQAGIARTPGFELEIQDPNTGRISVKGDHPNKEAIEKIVNGDPALARSIQNTYGIASQYAGLARADQYAQRADQAKTEQEREAIWSTFPELYNRTVSGAPTDISFKYDGRQAAVQINQAGIGRFANGS